MQTAVWTMVQISVATTETVSVEHVNAKSETTQRNDMKGSTVNVTTSTATDPTTNYVEVSLHIPDAYLAVGNITYISHSWLHVRKPLWNFYT